MCVCVCVCMRVCVCVRACVCVKLRHAYDVNSMHRYTPSKIMHLAPKICISRGECMLDFRQCVMCVFIYVCESILL